MAENPFMESFLQGIRETEASRRQKDLFAHEDDPNSAANQHWKAMFDDYQKRYGAEQARLKLKDTLEGMPPVDKEGNIEGLVKPGVSGGQPGVSSDSASSANVGVPGVGPLGRTQSEPALVNPPTTGFDVANTTLPSPGGPPVQPDSITSFANMFRMQNGMQGAPVAPPADTLNQPTPGLRQMPTQAGAATNDMVGQTPGGGGGGAVSPAINPLAAMFAPHDRPQQQVILPDGQGGYRRVQVGQPAQPEQDMMVQITPAMVKVGLAKPEDVGKTAPIPAAVVKSIAPVLFSGANQLTAYEEKPDKGEKMTEALRDKNFAAKAIAQEWNSKNPNNKIDLEEDNEYSDLGKKNPNLAMAALNRVNESKETGDLRNQRRAITALNNLIVSQSDPKMVHKLYQGVKTGKIDPDKIDQHIRPFVQAEMVDDHDLPAPITKSAQDSIARAKPILDAVNELRAELRKKNFDYEGLGFMAAENAKYMAGGATGKTAEFIGKQKLSNIMQIGGVIRGLSRAFGIYKQAEQHVPNMWLDNKEEMIGKLDNIAKVLGDGVESQMKSGKYGQVLPGNGAPSNIDLNQFLKPQQ